MLQSKMPKMTGHEASTLAYFAQCRKYDGIIDKYQQIKDELSLPVRELAEQILGISQSSNNCVINTAEAIIEGSDRSTADYIKMYKKAELRFKFRQDLDRILKE